MKKLLVICLILHCAWNALNGQKVIAVQKTQYIPLSGVSGKTADTLYKTVERAFNFYQFACTLKDTKTGNVTQQSIDKYLNLFEFNANVPLDYQLIPNPPEVKAPDYATFLYKHLPQGFDNHFVKAEFSAVNYDALGFYRVFVEAVRHIRNGVSADFTPVTLSDKDSCLQTQYFVFYIEKKDIQNAKIFKIYNDGPRTCLRQSQPGRHSFYLHSGYGWAKVKSKSNDNWADSTVVEFRPQNISVLHIAAGWSYPLRNKPIDLLLGLQYSTLQSTLALDTFKYELREKDALDPDKTDFLKFVGLGQLQEEGRLGIIQLQLGARFKALQKERFSLGLEVLLMPGRVLRYENAISGNLSYSSLYNYSNSQGAQVQVVIEDPLPNPAYKNGKFHLQDSLSGSQPALYRWFLAAQIAPVANWQLNERLQLRMGAYFQFSATPWFKSGNAATPFAQSPKDLPYSLLSGYVDRFKVNHLGLQAGLQYQF